MITQLPRLTLFLLLALLWVGLVRAEAAGLQAGLDRNRIVEGETVLLTLTAPGDSWGVPALDALEADFDVESQGQSTNMTIVNGQASSTREWRFLLAPKRAGSLTVPAIEMGGLESAPIPLEVLPAAQADRLGEALPVMVEVEVDKEAPYVQGQVVYTARVLLRTQVDQASLEDPQADGVIIERLGEDRSYETWRDGQRYKVIERRYALFPQRSGTLDIAPPVLSGGIADPARRGGSPRSAFERFFGRDPFADMGSPLQRTRPIKVSGRALSLAVRPQPEGSGTPWLPAESLQLADTWAPDLAKLRVGEPITRTIAITAQGLSAAQLPDLLPSVPDGVKLYPDKPRTETRAEGDDLVAVKELKYALVPSAAGELTLPEVRLAWWDTAEERARVAVLPERVVQVLPAQGGTASTPPARAPAPAGAEGSAEAPPLAPSAPAAPPASDGSQGPTPSATPEGRFPLAAGWWPWLAAGLALLWLATLALWLRERARRRPAVGLEPGQRQRQAVPGLAAARAAVRRACASDDPRASRDALLAWAAACWPESPPSRLESLASRLGGAAGEVLRDLDRGLYAPAGPAWRGPAAWERLGPALAQAEAGRRGVKGQGGPLPPLYPQGV